MLLFFHSIILFFFRIFLNFALLNIFFIFLSCFTCKFCHYDIDRNVKTCNICLLWCKKINNFIESAPEEIFLSFLMNITFLIKRIQFMKKFIYDLIISYFICSSVILSIITFLVNKTKWLLYLLSFLTENGLCISLFYFIRTLCQSCLWQKYSWDIFQIL